MELCDGLEGWAGFRFGLRRVERGQSYQVILFDCTFVLV